MYAEFTLHQKSTDGGLTRQDFNVAGRSVVKPDHATRWIQIDNGDAVITLFFDSIAQIHNLVAAIIAATDAIAMSEMAARDLPDEIDHSAKAQANA